MYELVGYTPTHACQVGRSSYIGWPSEVAVSRPNLLR
jgi:hypothetical protein